MRLATPRMVLRRAVVAAPFMASALVLAGGHGWRTVLFCSAFGWTVLVQSTNGLIGVMRRRARLAITGAVACSIGPAAWVWGAIYELARSALAATCVALVATVVFMVGWAWASRPDSIGASTPPRPDARPRRKSRLVKSRLARPVPARRG